MNSIGATGGDTLFLLTEIENLKKELAALEQKAQSIDSGLANAYWLSGGTQIGENDNLNSYTIPGNYYCNTNVLASTLQNCPIESAFTLKVELSAGVSYLCQTIREFVTGRTFYRMVLDSGDWVAWRSSALQADTDLFDTKPTTESIDNPRSIPPGVYTIGGDTVGTKPCDYGSLINIHRVNDAAQLTLNQSTGDLLTRTFTGGKLSSWNRIAMQSDFGYTDVTMDVTVGLTEVPNITGMEYIPVILRANVAYDGISVYGRMHTNTWVIESNHAQNMTVRFFRYPT